MHARLLKIGSFTSVVCLLLIGLVSSNSDRPQALPGDSAVATNPKIESRTNSETSKRKDYEASITQPTGEASVDTTHPKPADGSAVSSTDPLVELGEQAKALPQEQLLVWTDWNKRFPNVDPTDLDGFDHVTVGERKKIPLAANERELDQFHAWLAKVEKLREDLVLLRVKNLRLKLTGKEVDQNGFERAYTITGFRRGHPHYVYTQNAGAAESTGVNLVRLIPTFDTSIPQLVDGSGLYVNINDHGTIYDQNPEFQLPSSGGTRVLFKEVFDAGDRSHMTHCAGTVGAWGYNSALTGMAPRIWIRSLIQQSTTDITGFGMRWPGHPTNTINPRTGEIELRSVLGSASLGSSDNNTNRGIYTNSCAAIDYALYDTPYFIYFLAAANDGSSYSTLALDWAISKNAVTIGSVSDTIRDANGNYQSGGNISSFSSRGPTFDGRVKPDLVANGEGLTSTTSATGSGSKSGTSMATPNASGSAALLIDYIGKKLPKHQFLSSTIKALMINSATDRGSIGPDYTYGWGIINIKAAAEIVRGYAESPRSSAIVEDELAPSQIWTRSYLPDGTGTARVTLTWIDPPGEGQDSDDADRSPKLINDLNLRIVSQSGTVHHPYVMPFVTGGYGSALRGEPASQGINTTDNVEQVLVAMPSGAYTIEVSHAGALSQGTPQKFSLVVSGLKSSTPVAPAIESASPAIGNAVNGMDMQVHGAGFILGADVFLRKEGELEYKAYGVRVVNARIQCKVDAANLPKGYWDVVVRLPDDSEVILPKGFFLPVPSSTRVTLYSNNFENGSEGLVLGSGWQIGPPQKQAFGGPEHAYQGTNALVTFPGTECPHNHSSSTVTLATSGIGYADIRLEYARWIGMRYVAERSSGGGSFDYAGIQYALVSAPQEQDWLHLAYFYDISDSSWTATTHLLPFSATNSGTIRIRFNLDTDALDASLGWCVDELKITAAQLHSPPEFLTEPQRNATVGIAYSYSLGLSDADTSIAAVSVAVSGMPDGLSLSFLPDGSGVIQGTPTQSGVFNVRISASDGNYTTFRAFQLIVAPSSGNTPPTILTENLPFSPLGQAFNATILASDPDGGYPVLTIGKKPSWLNFTDHGNGTATLTGVPTSPSEYELKVQAFDGLVTVSKTYLLSVYPAASVGFSSSTLVTNENIGVLQIAVYRTNSSLGQVSLSYATANGTAIVGTNYVGSSGTLTWSDGDASPRFINVAVNPTQTMDADKTFTVQLSNLSGFASLGTSLSTVTIRDTASHSLGSLRMLQSAIGAYDSAQDGSNGLPTSGLVSNGGTSIIISGNAWKRLPLSYEVLPTTVVEFTVQGNDTGEMLGIALDNDNSATNTPRRSFRFGGSDLNNTSHDAWSWKISPTYSGAAPAQRYVIRVGEYFTGTMTHLCFIGDDDANGSTSATFSDIKLYSNFSEWRASYSVAAIENETSDSDLDSLPLLLEYALGADPKQSSEESKPVLLTSPGTLKLRYPKFRAGLTYFVESSGDMQSWSITGIDQGTGAVGNSVDATISHSGNLPLFLRLRVRLP